MNYSNLIYISFLFFCSAVSTAQEDWTLVKEDGTLTVYERKLDGSDFKEVKILGSVECNLSEFVAALEDVESQSDWVESTKEIRILDKTAANDFVFYQVTDMPYPVQDRDVVLKYSRSKDPNTKIINIDYTSVSDYIPLNDDYTRITRLHSSYVIEQKDESIHFEYYLKIDVGGKLPKWVINIAVTKAPLDTIKALFKALETGKYGAIVIEGISEK